MNSSKLEITKEYITIFANFNGQAYRIQKLNLKLGLKNYCNKICTLNVPIIMHCIYKERKV